VALDRSGKASPNMSNNEQNEPEHHINVGPGRKTPHKPDQVLPGMWNLCHESMAERSRLHGIKNRNQNRKRRCAIPVLPILWLILGMPDLVVPSVHRRVH